MGLEMVADDDYVSAGVVGGIHRLGRMDSPSYDEGHGYLVSHVTDDIRRDGSLGARTGFQIDGFFSHQFCGDTGIYNRIYIGRIERLGVCDAHGGSFHSTVNEDIGRRDHFNGRVMYGSRRLNLLIHKIFRITSGEQRKEKNSVRFFGKLLCVTGEENDGDF